MALGVHVLCKIKACPCIMFPMFRCKTQEFLGLCGFQNEMFSHHSNLPILILQFYNITDSCETEIEAVMAQSILIFN
jgi:hypothetical protein